MEKDFDCVQMKRKIQVARRQWERVLADPVLGKRAREKWPELSNAEQHV